MNFNKNDIEFYLLTKEYDALTKEELTIVSEAVNSKEEYQSLKQLLLVMDEAPAELELEPAPEIKEKLITSFEKARWGTEVGIVSESKVIPLKKEKNKKRGGFLWISIAASLTLLIGLFLNREALFMPENNQLALVETKEVKEVEQPKNGIDKSEKETESLKVETINESNNLVVEIEESSAEAVSTELLNVPSTGDAKRIINNNAASYKWSNEVEEELVDDFLDEEVAEDVDLASLINKDVRSNQLAESSVEPEFNISKNENLAFSDANFSSNTEKGSSSVNESVSLKDDKDLIDLLYTAL